MFILKHKGIFLLVGAVLVLASWALIVAKGVTHTFNTSIEFKGGTLLEVSYVERPSLVDLKTAVSEVQPDATVQLAGENNIVIRSEELSETDREEVLAALEIHGQDPALERVSTIGPSIGRELKGKAILALVFVLLGILFYLAYVFRKVSKPVSSWKYAIVAIVTLIHDISIPTGLFLVLNLEISPLFIVGLLSILGFSVNDTIVVFDRIREHLRINQEKGIEESFTSVVGKSLKETMARSINTSLTVFFVLVALLVVGPVSVLPLTLVLLFGVFFGAYSSIFIASPLLVLWNKEK